LKTLIFSAFVLCACLAMEGGQEKPEQIEDTESVLAFAKKMKAAGNVLFKSGEWNAAVNKYSDGIDSLKIDPKLLLQSRERTAEESELLAQLLNNRATARLREGSPAYTFQVLVDTSEAIDVLPTYLKPKLRFLQAIINVLTIPENDVKFYRERATCDYLGKAAEYQRSLLASGNACLQLETLKASTGIFGRVSTEVSRSLRGSMTDLWTFSKIPTLMSFVQQQNFCMFLDRHHLPWRP